MWLCSPTKHWGAFEAILHCFVFLIAPENFGFLLFHGDWYQNTNRITHPHDEAHFVYGLINYFLCIHIQINFNYFLALLPLQISLQGVKMACNRSLHSCRKIGPGDPLGKISPYPNVNSWKFKNGKIYTYFYTTQ